MENYKKFKKIIFIIKLLTIYLRSTDHISEKIAWNYKMMYPMSGKRTIT